MHSILWLQILGRHVLSGFFNCGQSLVMNVEAFDQLEERILQTNQLKDT